MRLKIRLTILLLSSLGCSLAQNKQLLYDFYEIPQSIMVNPGVQMPYKWAVGIPALSGIHLQAGSSGIAAGDLFANDGIDFNQKFREQVVQGLNKRDEFGGSGTIEILHIGFRRKNKPEDYISFGAYGEGFIAQYWPEDLARLAFEGNGVNIAKRFDLNHLASQGEMVSVFHLGLNRQLQNGWTVGGRAKIYSSVWEYKTRGNNGYFITTVGEDNLYRNTLVADISIKSSGLKAFVDILEEDTGSTQADLVNTFIGRALMGGNLGLGFDLGFTKTLSKNAVVTASLIDLGFIYHSNAIRNYTFRGSVLNEGLEIRLPEDADTFDPNLWGQVIDDISNRVPFQKNEEAFLSLRPTKLYVSYRQNFGGNNTSSNDCNCNWRGAQTTNDASYSSAIGGQLFVINRPRGPQAALSAFAQQRLGNFATFKATYTIDKFSQTNIGAGLSLKMGPVNFYVLADNLLGYQNLAQSRYQSFQFGLNLLSWNDN